MKGRIDLEEIVKEYQMKALFGQLDEPKVAVIIHRKPKRFIIMIAAVIASFSLVIVTVSAMGYNPIELIRNALNSSNRIATDNRGDGVMLSDDIRVYNSMSEMLEKENLNILYPAKLPDKYEFTEFKITDFGDILVAGSYNIEPYISFEIRIGAGIPIEDYSHEINGIRYTITERDSMYDVAWSYGTDYYTIVVGDKTIISEIIENLKES
ncbi:MAG: hypothetical protein FWH07_02890 [Oscillospiraceae bacterium]|nr:hypothetical protein [Oscillospiraceae bacterium]